MITVNLFIKKLTRNELGFTGANTHGEIYVPRVCLDFFPELNDGPRPECSFTAIHRTDLAFRQFEAFVTVYEKGEAHLRRMQSVLGPHVQPGDFLSLRKVSDNLFEANVIRHDSKFAAFLETHLGNDVAAILTESDIASVTSSSGATFDRLMETASRVPESANERVANSDDGRNLVTDHPLTNGMPPEWASEWGHDEFGPWCSFDVDGIQQRLRWVPAGQFQMGVADEYKGLFAQIGPRHWETLARGFWMFETRCSLRLFNAVKMGTAQAAAADDGSAVHLHYWTARNFCGKLSEMLGGVVVTLPAEAQWEFACRAGRQDGPYFDLDFDRTDRSNPWGLRSMLSGTGEFCSDAPRLSSDKAVVDHLGDKEKTVVCGLPRSIPGVLRHTSPLTIDEKSANHFERKTHPSFRKVVESTSSTPDVGFRCIIAEDIWEPATRPEGRRSEDFQSSDNSSKENQGESKDIERNVTPLSLLLRDMASQLHHYYSELIEPASGIEARWKLEDGHPLCEAGRKVAGAVPDFGLDSKGHRNLPGRGGRLWYLLLRTSRLAKFEDARPFLITAAHDLAVWLRDHYPNELPHTFVVGDIPFALRLDNLQSVLTLRNLSASQTVGTGTGWPADEHPLVHAAVQVLVAIPDAITAPDGTPNFPGVGSDLWPQLKNLVMTTDDSPTGTRKRTAMAQQFRDWLTNRYRKDSLEATGIEASPAIEKPVQLSSSSNEPKDNKFDVFLSYSSADKEAIEPVVAGLRNQGLTVFIDREHLTLGDSVNSAIRQAIRNSRCLVVCLSESELGDWQRSEIESYVARLSEDEGRRVSDSVVPVMLPGADVPYNAKPDWNTKRWLDFRNGFGDAELEQLMDVIVERVKAAQLF